MTTFFDSFCTVNDFDSEVGVSFLRGMHLNGSKCDLGSRRDRHSNIGMYVLSSHLPRVLTYRFSRGKFAISTFCHILTDPRTQNIPLILETPSFEANEIWEKEIDVLNRIATASGSGLDLDGLAADIKSVVGRYA
jgi:AP endonuclease-1